MVIARKNSWRSFVGCMAALMAISLNNVQSLDTKLAEQYSLKPFVSRVISIVKTEPLYFYGVGDYGVIFYAGRHLHRLPVKVASPFYLLVWENDWRNVEKYDGMVVQATSEEVDRQDPKRGHLLLVAVSDTRALAFAREPQESKSSRPFSPRQSWKAAPA